MADRLFAIDDQTFLFPDQVRDAYFSDVHSQIVDVVGDLDGVATAVANKVTPLVTDNLVSPLLTTGTVTRDSMDGRYRSATIIRVTTANGIDYTTKIQAALDAGNDVEIVGPATGKGICRTAATLKLNPASPGQMLTTRNATIQPAHPFDGIQITTKSVVSVQIAGFLQPTTGVDYTDIAAIRIGGVQGFDYNPMQAAVPYCTIQNWNGNGIIWEHGSMIDFTHTYIGPVTVDGIRAITAYDDNNHGHFLNTHVVAAGRYGYVVQYGGAFVSPYQGTTGFVSAAHQFLNAKAFGCGQNFRIESHSNVGTVFSEAGTNPDSFESTARANSINVIGTVTAGENWVDLSPAGSNELQIFANGDYRTYRTLRARNFRLGSTQYTNSISGKYNTGSLSLPANTVVDLNPGVGGLGDGRVVQATPFTPNGLGVTVTAYVDGGGGLHFQIYNSTSSTKTYAATISYVVSTFI